MRYHESFVRTPICSVLPAHGTIHLSRRTQEQYSSLRTLATDHPGTSRGTIDAFDVELCGLNFVHVSSSRSSWAVKLFDTMESIVTHRESCFLTADKVLTSIVIAATNRFSKISSITLALYNFFPLPLLPLPFFLSGAAAAAAGYSLAAAAGGAAMG